MLQSLRQRFKLQGECNQCGKCCTLDIMWIGFDPSKPNEKRDRIEWADARGYSVVQSGVGIIQANVNHRCPNLEENNTCKIQENKPRDCTAYPDNIFEIYQDYQLDLNKMLPEGCGFHFVEIDRG